MLRSRLEPLLRRWLGNVAASRGLPAVCAALAFAGTLTAAYPVTAIVVPAALLAPRRWQMVTVSAALGSALGATALVAALNDLGWSQIYERFPDLADNAWWARVSAWVESYGTFALFVVAATPLPQTPALIFYAMARHDLATVLVAMFAGKLLKYGAFAWVAAYFPERFSRHGAGDRPAADVPRDPAGG